MPRSGPVQYRRATPADLEAEHLVFCRAEGAVQRAHDYPWEDPPVERFALGLRQLLAHDAERCFVAELDGKVVGYTGALLRGDTWFFSMLFIDPEAQGRGIGRRLFELAAEGAPARRLTITDSIQPISNALYGRHGLLPVNPPRTSWHPSIGRPTASSVASIMPTGRPAGRDTAGTATASS